jgi:hypothetical protein
MQKVYFINNATDQTVAITQGSGSTVSVPAGTKKLVYCDGAGSGATVTDLTDNLSLSGEVNITTFKLDGVEVTADAAEINKLDGLLASTAELNVLDGITATTGELNKVDGFTGNKDDLNYAKDLRATGVTTTEFNKLDGVTSGIQSQLNSLESDKAEESITISAGGGLSGGGSLAANRTISHADTSSQGSVNNSGNTVVQDITVDTYGHVTNINSKTIEPMPVGATFIQFPGYSAPNSLFGGSWSAIFDNEGIFFRTPGLALVVGFKGLTQKTCLRLLITEAVRILRSDLSALPRGKLTSLLLTAMATGRGAVALLGQEVWKCES